MWSSQELQVTYKACFMWVLHSEFILMRVELSGYSYWLSISYSDLVLYYLVLQFSEPLSASPFTLMGKMSNSFIRVPFRALSMDPNNPVEVALRYCFQWWFECGHDVSSRWRFIWCLTDIFYVCTLFQFLAAFQWQSFRSTRRIGFESLHRQSAYAHGGLWWLRIMCSFSSLMEKSTENTRAVCL